MSFGEHQTVLKDRRQTSDEIKRLVKEYHADLEDIVVPMYGTLVSASHLPFNHYFDFIKRLRYKRDVAPVEQVGRPKWIIDRCGNTGKGLDCKKKAVMIASWLHMHKIPYRFIGSSSRPDREIHHIFPQAFLGGEWVNVDATYKNYSIGKAKHVTDAEVL